MGSTNMKTYPSTILATYSDLVQRLQDDQIIEIGGEPTKRTLRGRDYWYAITYVGRKQVERYLGPDSDRMRERIEQIKEHKADLKKREKDRGALVRILRGSGLPSPDLPTGKTLLALSRAGVFRLRGVLVGTHAYRCYPAILGSDLVEAHAPTQDIDIAQSFPISIAIDDHVDPKISEALRAVGGFKPRPGLHPAKPTSWRDAESGLIVEILTPNEGPDRDSPMELPALETYAQPLRFLDFLIYEPIPAAVLYRYGVLVNVPRPARYAVHKLIVATRRNNVSAEKATKDIRQAAELIGILSEAEPDELHNVWIQAYERGKKWRDALESGMRRLPANIRTSLQDLIKA